MRFSWDNRRSAAGLCLFDHVVLVHPRDELVEDEVGVRRILCGFLRGGGYRVIEAPDADAAVEKLVKLIEDKFGEE